MVKQPETYEEAMSTFLGTVKNLTDSIEEHIEYLDSINETDRTKAHYTLKTIRQWFNNRGDSLF